MTKQQWSQVEHLLFSDHYDSFSSCFSFHFRPVHHHFCGGDAAVCQAYDWQWWNHLDWILLLVVVHVRLRRLHPPHPQWSRSAAHLHATYASQPLGDLHGCRAGHPGLNTTQVHRHIQRWVRSATGLNIELLYRQELDFWVLMFQEDCTVFTNHSSKIQRVWCIHTQMSFLSL